MGGGVTVPFQLLCREAKPHNHPVANTAWQQRIRRAEKLAAQYSFATEILSFYGQVARFQQDIYQRIERDGGGVEPRSAGARPAVEWASRPLTGQREAEVTKLRFSRLWKSRAPNDLRRSPANCAPRLPVRGPICWTRSGPPPARRRRILKSSSPLPFCSRMRSSSAPDSGYNWRDTLILSVRSAIESRRWAFFVSRATAANAASSAVFCPDRVGVPPCHLSPDARPGG